MTQCVDPHCKTVSVVWFSTRYAVKRKYLDYVYHQINGSFDNV